MVDLSMAMLVITRGQYSIIQYNDILVGGFNPPEKYEWIIIPTKIGNIKAMFQTFPNHQSVSV